MQIDPELASKHKKIYNELLDSMDADIVKEIMYNPYGDAARLLDKRVAMQLDKELNNK